MASWPVALIVLFPAALWAYEVAQSVEDKLAANEANYYAVDATGLLVGKHPHTLDYNSPTDYYNLGTHL